jgi:oligopeptidase B
MPNEIPVPPTVPTIGKKRELHGRILTDEYGWMRNVDDPRFRAYLHDERAHYDRATEHLGNLRDELFDEMRCRLLPTDESVSWRRGDNFYTMRSVTGSEYEQFLSTRYPGETPQVVLDEATLADEPGGYVAIGLREVSPDNRLLAYSVDTQGDEVFTLRFRDLPSGADLPDIAPRSYYGGAWSADSSTFFYVVHDEAYRPYQIWRHKIGTDCNQDVLVYAEDDVQFDVNVRASTSGQYVFITTENRDTSEVWFVPAGRPEAAPAVVRPRSRTIEYSVDHAGDSLVIVTNDGAPEFRLMTAPVSEPSSWTPAATARPGERLHTCHVLATHLLLELRRDGFPLLRTIDRSTGTERDIDAGIPAGRISLYKEPEYGARAITVEIESLTSPNAWYEIDLAAGTRAVVKQLTVPGFDPAAYRTSRHFAPAPDGTLVPVTLAHRADTPLDGTAPCLMWGYGAYESCDDPEFDIGLISLLDRGVVYAQTHPRGGGENGRAWWEGGRLAAKATTFTDHLAAANWLAGAAPDATGGSGPAALVDGTRIATRGLSAGGLLQAVCARLAPERWAAVVAEVPFVDVVGSMLDETIPLTANEWDEWGDPRRAADFEWMAAYSPYENLPASPRPPMLVTAALHDPRVLVHEPTKYVARLRSLAKPGDVLLYRVELGAGAHTGPSGRYAHFRYEAEIYAWLAGYLGV